MFIAILSLSLRYLRGDHVCFRSELLVMRVFGGIGIGADYPIAHFHDYGVFQHPPARVLHQFYRRDVVRRRDLRQHGEG